MPYLSKMHKNHRHHKRKTLAKDMSAQHRFIHKAIFFVAVMQPIAVVPQAIVVYRTQDASGLAIPTWLIYFAFDICWLWYGIADRQKPVIISATLFTLFEGSVAAGALLYGGTWW